MRMRLALLNDYEVVVRGLAAMLRGYGDQFTLVEVAAGKPLAEPVDVALYDTFAQPQGDQADVRRAAENPAVGKLAVYTWNFQRDSAQLALQNGAAAYLSKALPASALVSALRQVYAGDVVISPKPDRAAVFGGEWPGREEGLTARESEVIALITQGMSNADIVQRTSLSINSVKSYIRTAYRKMGVVNRANAVLWGVEHGFRPDHMRERHSSNAV